MYSNMISGKIKIKNDWIYLKESVQINSDEDGYFILDFDAPCSYPEIEVYPAKYVVCEDEKERYTLYKYNWILGKGDDICLI